MCILKIHIIIEESNIGNEISLNFTLININDIHDLQKKFILLTQLLQQLMLQFQYDELITTGDEWKQSQFRKGFLKELKGEDKFQMYLLHFLWMIEKYEVDNMIHQYLPLEYQNLEDFSKVITAFMQKKINILPEYLRERILPRLQLTFKDENPTILFFLEYIKPYLFLRLQKDMNVSDNTKMLSYFRYSILNCLADAIMTQLDELRIPSNLRQRDKFMEFTLAQ